MFGLGAHELIIVGIVAVLLFGRKLPEVARSLGSSYKEFRKGLNEFQSSVNVDSYSPSTSSYGGSSSTPRLNDDYADTATAPKFEPPPAEPKASDPAGGESAESDGSAAATSSEGVSDESSALPSEEKRAGSNT
jgi:sec-independent protein translocase protein TatA